MKEADMGDLISRSALIEAITQHGKDIKSDVPMIEDIYQTAHKHIIDLVKIQPTAYDTEKVVAELACNSRFIDDINEHNIKCISCVIGQKTAIEIVKGGGVE